MPSRCARLFASLILVCGAAAAQTINRQNLATYLGFENGQPGLPPPGWGSSPGTVFVDDQVVHGGRLSARMERTATTAGEFSSFSATIPVDFGGQTIQWRGYIKTENVTGFVAFYVNEFVSGITLAFNTLQGQNINGTRDWMQYTVSVPVIFAAGTQVSFGFLLSGTGKAWVDDTELLVDGVPAASAPLIPAPFRLDREFDAGSKITNSSFTEIQVKNLATLAKVWGFAKYHHPAVTAGKHHWDYELFRILRKVLNAEDFAAANQQIHDWLANLGEVAPCDPCATLDDSRLHLPPDIDWIRDESVLGADLSHMLLTIHQNRTPETQFYVSLVPGVRNPRFEYEPPYPTLRLPDTGYQLLALFRYWNMVEYFSPNREIMADDPASLPNYWNEVLEEFIPAIGLARTSVTYQQQLMRFITKLNDTHANLWSSIGVRPPVGPCQLPVDVRFVEGKPLVIKMISRQADDTSGLLPGDVIERLDQVPINDLIAEWRPYYADSNEPTRLRDISQYLTRGACGPVEVEVQRGDETVSVSSNRIPASAIDNTARSTSDRPGDTFQLLSDDVAYLKLSSVRIADVPSYIARAQGTKGLIVDIRNYPSEFVVFALGSRLLDQPTNFVRFTEGDLSNPGAFHWTEPLGIFPQAPRYQGKVVILINEVTQSQAEYTTMALRTAPNAVVIGSTTAGADGNVSSILLPGNLSSYISGIGVFYPDKRPTQRIGILPDIVVTPTIEGVRAGRDELVEEAIRQIRGQEN
jgi:C-terminal processing protease CtpA/Prc